jgi:RNA polymerase sigma factor (sigma-70 family)
MNKVVEKNYAMILKKYKPVSSDEESLLFEKVAQGDIEARNKLISANLRFVVTMAFRNKSKGDINELISAGNIGLIKAIEKFDPSKGFKFTTYAAWWINEAIDRLTNKENELIYVPVGVVGKIKSIKAIIARLSHELNRYPTYDEIAAESNLSAEKVEEYLNYSYGLNSGDDHDEDSQSIFDTMKDDALAVEDHLYEEQVDGRIKAAIEMLTEREQFIVKSLYEVGNYESGLTFLELGKSLNISRERVRQINIKALDQLKEYLADMNDMDNIQQAWSY